MIVDPDFFDHWKTVVLVELLEDEKAPIYVLRLWAHCQNRKQSSFDSLSPKALKALCRYSGHPEKLLSSLVESGFVTVDDEGRLEVCGWDDYNAKLVSNWENGKKGGRPKKPNGNPTLTHAEPIREDKRRVDKKYSLKHSWLEKPSFAKEWKRFDDHLWECWQTRLGQVQAESILMELGRTAKDADDAAAMIAFTIARGAKNIITNGDHRNGSQKATAGSSKASGVPRI